MKRPTLKLKKETVRILAPRTLAADELAKVAGGTGTRLPHYTRCCG